MNYTIEFQYKPHDSLRPHDECQELDISSNNGAFIPIPTVGDSIHLEGKNYKVLTRHFIYSPGHCCVCITTTDISNEEMGARLKS